MGIELLTDKVAKVADRSRETQRRGRQPWDNCLACAWHMAVPSHEELVYSTGLLSTQPLGTLYGGQGGSLADTQSSDETYLQSLSWAVAGSL